MGTLTILDGEGCKLVAKYYRLLHLAEVRLETVMASTKDENQEPADAAASGLGDEVKSEIESIVLEAAHNACKPGCDGGEDKSKGEGWREQGCGVLEAKVEGRVHLKIGGEDVEGEVEATLHGTIKLTLPDRIK